MTANWLKIILDIVQSDRNLQSEATKVLTENKNSSNQHRIILLTELLKGKIN